MPGCERRLCGLRQASAGLTEGLLGGNLGVWISVQFRIAALSLLGPDWDKPLVGKRLEALEQFCGQPGASLRGRAAGAINPINDGVSGLNIAGYNRSVTKLLEKALEAASDLPPAEQDELAGRILDEIAWERGGGREKLRRLVDEAREDIRAGRVRELRPEDI